MMHPFLDTRQLTDEQIIEKLGRAYTYMNAQVALGHTPTVESIREVIETLEGERVIRMSRIMDEHYKEKNPESLSPIDIGKIDEQ